MIWLLNNRLHYTGDYIIKKYKNISFDNYPAQNYNFLGGVIFLPYKDEKLNLVNKRLNISKIDYPDFEGESSEGLNLFKILRFDKEEPFVGIFVNINDDVIIADTRDILNYKMYPNYYFREYDGIKECRLSMAATWEEFNEAYAKEKILNTHIQSEEYLGKPVYLEFFKTILEESKEVNILDRTYVVNPSARYNQDELNVPLRVTLTGHIIKADENGYDANIVVMVEDEAGDRKYFLGSEGLYYYDTEAENVKISDLNLWQKKEK